jgi:hypothetical protein
MKHTPLELHIIARLKAGWRLRAKIWWCRPSAALIKGKTVEEVSYNPIKSLRDKGVIVPISRDGSETLWRLR